MKVNEAVAPATFDCMAAPPLHPKRRFAFVHLLSKVTAAWDSSTRAPATGNVVSLGVPVLPPGGGVLPYRRRGEECLPYRRRGECRPYRRRRRAARIAARCGRAPGRIAAVASAAAGNNQGGNNQGEHNAT